VFSSTIVPTICRPTLSRAVHSVLDQVLEEDDFEVIVVNDSGEPLPSADWHSSPRVRVIDTQRRERSVARNTGAATARGRYLHFLDDDDWLVPGALRTMWELAQRSPDAGWLYGSTRVADRQDRPLLQLRHGLQGNAFTPVMAGEWIPLQASFIKADAFFAVGGFAPTLSGPEDVDLCRRVLLRGQLAGTAADVAWIAMGREGSSTDYDRHASASRRARERILDQPGVATRLRASATSPEWLARIVRIYLTSAVWNVQHRRGFTAASRLVFAVLSLVQSGGYVLVPDYWRAVATAYRSHTFERGLRASCAGRDPMRSSAQSR
jgi:glycosyltransferase involved in cell wall biosynthesis